MRSPEVAEAIPKLVERGLLAPATAAPLLRSARGELLSIRGELRAVMYFGVLAVVAGVSLLVKENLDRIGPVTIAVAIGLAAAVCLGWTLRRALPFTWQRAESSDWAFDFLLLLGILLLGADLAYIEAKFTPLGDAWSYHLLVMSLVTGAFAVRCDSRVLWSLALSTFAAWRGVAATSVAQGVAELEGRRESALRLELMLCGAAFLALGFVLRRFDRKRHFEPLTTFLGSLGLLAGLGLFALDPAGELAHVGDCLRCRGGWACRRGAARAPFRTLRAGCSGNLRRHLAARLRTDLPGRLRLFLVRRQLGRHDRPAVDRAAALPGGGDMRREIAAADRQFVVRRAASAWRKAGKIDAAAEAAIAALYADDRVRTSRIFRILFFVFAWFGFSTAYGFGLVFLSAAGLDWNDTAVFAAVNMLTGVAVLAATELLTGKMKLRRFGIEEACVWIGSSYLLGGGLWWLLEGFDAGFSLLLVAGSWVTAALATLIVWRWATPGMGAVAALAIFAALSQAPANHLLWLLVAGLLAWPLGTLSIAAHVSPEQRKRFGEAFVVFVAMFYFAVHVAVIEARLFTLAQWIDDDQLGPSARQALAGIPVELDCRRIEPRGDGGRSGGAPLARSAAALSAGAGARAARGAGERRELRRSPRPAPGLAGASRRGRGAHRCRNDGAPVLRRPAGRGVGGSDGAAADGGSGEPADARGRGDARRIHARCPRGRGGWLRRGRRRVRRRRRFGEVLRLRRAEEEPSLSRRV